MRYKQLPNGDYLDVKTNLIWKQHPEVMEYTYDEALKLQQNGWRVPSVEELLALIDYRLNALATELPNMRQSFFWSCSPYSDYSTFAWTVHFDCGSVSFLKRNNPYTVRLVRDAEPIISNPIDDAVKAASVAIDDYLLSRVDPVLDALYEARDAAIKAQRMINEISK
jgi:hypothetical protein